MIKLLDCTLRDGGYYTNWDFDKELVSQYCQYVDKLPIEYIEVGYRSIAKNEYMGEYFYLPVLTLKNIQKYTDKKLAIMLNAKDCEDIDLVKLLAKTKEYISLIRIATDPDKIEISLILAKKLKLLGFDVSLNVMYISKIKENHKFFDYLEEIEDIAKYLYLVDSYGSISPQELKKLIKYIQSKTNIILGFHGHNNLELALTNTLIAIDNNVKLIDSTVLGMGRGAGNLKTELILTYLKANSELEVDLNILSKLTEIMQPLLDKYKWGTNLAYMVSGSYSLPQKDVMDALEIERYSLSGIISHLRNDNEIVLSQFECDDKYNNCIIIGGGKSIDYHIDFIKEYLLLYPDILLIHASSKYIQLFEELKNIQFFAVAGDELLKINSDMKFISKYILETSPRKINTYIDEKKEFYELKNIDFIDKYYDSPLTIALQLALDMNIENINLIGFDGYSELKNKKELYLMQENQNIIDRFTVKKELKSLTSTKYENLKKSSIYGVII